MPLGFLLLFYIGKSGAILTIYMAFHQAVKTAGKSIENRTHSQKPSLKKRFGKSPPKATCAARGQLGNNCEITPMVSHPCKN
jgi:hypothetical protein